MMSLLSFGWIFIIHNWFTIFDLTVVANTWSYIVSSIRAHYAVVYRKILENTKLDEVVHYYMMYHVDEIVANIDIFIFTLYVSKLKFTNRLALKLNRFCNSH